MKTTHNRPKLLMVGPMPAPGQYNGGIAVLLEALRRNWSLPYDLITFNMNLLARDYGTVNRVNLVNLRRFWRTAAGLSRVVRVEKPEIVYLHTSRHMAMMKDVVLARILKLSFAGSRILAHVHHASPRSLLMGNMPSLRKAQLSFLLSSVDRLILMCNSIRSDLEKSLSPARARGFDEKARVLYNFTSPHEPIEREIQNTCNIFYIGNLGRAKGVHDLLECIFLLRKDGVDVRGTLAGPFDSPEAERQLRAQAERLGLSHSVSFPGVLQGAHKDAAFRSADIFALPSYAEGVPISMLEAMSYSLPVVVTNVGGIPEIIGSGNSAVGVMVSPGNPGELARAIRSFVDSASLRRSHGANGRKAVQSGHSIEHFFAGLGCICREVDPGTVSESATLHGLGEKAAVP